MARLNKGIFYTFGAFFLVMLVVVLSLLVTQTLHQSNDRLSESGSMDRIYMMKVSLDKLISSIDNGMNINLSWNYQTNNTDLAISETLNTNFSDYGTDFYSEMQSLADFVESDQPEIEFDLSKVYNSTERIPIVTEPNNFRYTHINENNNIGLRIYPGVYLSQVQLNITQLNNTGTNVQWLTQNPGNDFLLDLSIFDSNGNRTSYSYLLNSTLQNTFRINNRMDLKIGVLCTQCLELSRNSTPISVSFIGSFPYTGEMITVNYPRETYLIDFDNLNILINSSPRIL